MLKKILLLSTIWIGLSANAQDVYFTEYNSSKINLNPAFAGSDSTFVLSSADRLRAGSSPYDEANILFFSADNYFHFLRGGLAICYSNTNIFRGSSITNQFHLSYAPHFELFNHRLAIQPGIELGVFSNKENYHDFIAPDGTTSANPGTDPSIPWSGSTVKSNIDVSTGLVIFTKRFYGGFAMHHINKPQTSLFGDSRLPVRYTIHAGANLTLGNFLLSPNCLLMMQDKSSFAQVGLRIKYKMLTFGLDFLSSNELVPEIGLQNRFFKLSYSYIHIMDSNNFYYNIPTHELHFNWYFTHKNKKQLSMRMI
ncbi:MAG TPA: PorP/SprF family type IX secretion system membrane protein [Bacteroidia bacterium]|jgi:type IX secretion system PorP/SprF family membrane protein|nr:PorP/SprF family type IX secretion system membrane protein [Bacteroidia bacterium]